VRHTYICAPRSCAAGRARVSVQVLSRAHAAPRLWGGAARYHVSSCSKKDDATQLGKCAASSCTGEGAKYQPVCAEGKVFRNEDCALW